MTTYGAGVAALRMLPVPVRRRLRLVAALGAVLILVDYGLIGSLALTTATSSSDLGGLLAIGAPLLVVRVLLGSLHAGLTARLVADSRRDVQRSLWAATLRRENFELVTAAPALHNRVLNHAPTDIAVGVASPAAAIASDVVALTVVAVVAVFVRPAETLIGGAVILVVLGVSGATVLLGARPAASQEAAALEGSHRTSWDVVHGARDVIINDAAEIADARGAEQAAELGRATRRVQLWSSGQRVFMESLTMSLILAVGAVGTAGGSAFIAIALVLRTLPIVTRLGANASLAFTTLQRIRHWGPSLVAAGRPAHGATSSRGADAGGSGSNSSGDVVLDVSIDPSARVASRVDFVVRRGEWVHLSGASGRGKSSVLDAVAGLWADAGVGVRRHFDRREIGYATQSPFLVSGSLLENVTLGRRHEPAWIEEAARISGLSDAFGPSWQQVQVDDRGANISGGQQQRVSLARAVLGRPRLVLIDEATANLDRTSENHIFARLREHLPGAAVILVSHRPPEVEWSLREVAL